MDLRELLNLFAALNDEGIQYVIVGSLAQTLRGDVSLTEAISVVVLPHTSRQIRRVVAAVWRDAALDDTAVPGVLFRILPARTPLFIEIVPGNPAALQSEMIDLNGLQIPVGKPEVYDVYAGVPTFARHGFTIRERLVALHALLQELGVSPAPLRGVRKYRSFEAAMTDRVRGSAMMHPGAERKR